MNKGYYLTFGVTSKDLSKVVDFIEGTFGFTLDCENVYDDELYILLEKRDQHFPIINNLVILNNFGNDFQNDEKSIKSVEFIISISITVGSEHSKKKSFTYLRKKILKSEDVVELNITTDEWD